MLILICANLASAVNLSWKKEHSGPASYLIVLILKWFCTLELTCILRTHRSTHKVCISHTQKTRHALGCPSYMLPLNYSAKDLSLIMYWEQTVNHDVLSDLSCIFTKQKWACQVWYKTAHSLHDNTGQHIFLVPKKFHGIWCCWIRKWHCFSKLAVVFEIF